MSTDNYGSTPDNGSTPTAPPVPGYTPAPGDGSPATPPAPPDGSVPPAPSYGTVPPAPSYGTVPPAPSYDAVPPASSYGTVPPEAPGVGYGQSAPPPTPTPNYGQVPPASTPPDYGQAPTASPALDDGQIPPASPLSDYTQGPIASPPPDFGQTPPVAPPLSFGEMPAAQGTGQFPSAPSFPLTPAPGDFVSNSFSTPSGPLPPLASFGQRAYGFLIDWVPMIVLGLIGGLTRSVIVMILCFLLMLAWGIYNVGYLGGTTGVSYGRRMAGTKLVREDTLQPIGFGMGIGRYFAHYIDSAICGLGFLFPLFTPKRQTIADMICRSIVIVNK